MLVIDNSDFDSCTKRIKMILYILVITNVCRYTRVGLAVCDAIACYERGDYAAATEHLLPHEWQLHCLGGSDAQRDVVSQLMIHAAVKSDRPEHNRTAQRLLAARKAKKNNSGLTDRLMALTLAAHPN